MRGAGSQASLEKLSVQTVRDRLLVTSDNEAGRSTAIISRLGRKFSFNIVNADGSHVSSDRLASLPPSSSAPEINNMDLFIPEYVPGPKEVGDVVSWLRDFRGIMQAAFIYKGLGTYRGREVLVLTLVPSTNGSRPNLSQAFGYSLVDRGTALPVSFSMRGNPSIKGEQTECAG